MRKLYASRIVLSLYVKICLLSVISIINIQSSAQTTLATPVPSGIVYYSDNAPGVIVFGVRNNNAYDIVVTEVASRLDAGWGGVYSLWYRTTGITGTPGAITTANGWIKASPSNQVAPTSNSVQPVVRGLNIVIPANTTYRFALEAPVHGPVYGTANSQPDIVSGGGVDIYLQGNTLSPNYSGAFPGPPTNTPRGFYGSITFNQYTACSTPPVAGVSGAFPAVGCSGVSRELYLTGNSIATGQTYVWQSASTLAGPYTDISTSSATPYLNVTPTTTTFYRAAVSCNGGTPEYSTPVEVQVNQPMSGGTYTINPANPASSTNFQTLTAAVNALNCGVGGPIVFDVAPGSNFTEQITIGQIQGASAVNTIKFLGNGSTIQATPVTGNRAMIRLDGADYITIDSFNITTNATDFGWGIHLTNGADSNTIRANTIDISAVTSTTQSNSGGVVMSGSNTSVLTDGSGSHNRIESNVIKGGYQGIIITGTTNATNAKGNIITRNTIHDFYANGIELADNDSATVSFNDIHRMNRVAVTTFAGVELNGATKRTVVDGNRIHDTHNTATTQSGTAYGVFSSSNDAPVGEENWIINNLIYNFNSATGTQNGFGNTGSNGVFYYHNTIVLDHGASTAGATRGFYQTTTATNIDFRNNIVYVTRGGSGTKHGVYFNTAASGITSNRNAFFVNASGSPVGIGSIGTTNYATLADWQAVVNGTATYDQQSISVDPMFTNAAGGDFTPMEASINGLGANVGVDHDILGNSRTVTAPDPGAYEYNITGLDADINWVAPVMPVTAGLKTITVNVTNTQTATINSIQLAYTDGTAIVTQTFTGLGLTAGNSTQLSFTTQYNLTQSVRMRAYINLVNGTQDNSQLNDSTAYQNLCLPLSGDYSINPSLPTGGSNFTTLTEAVNQLACSGVDGPVRFNVEPGSFFAEQITIPEITGASSSNTIRFLGNGAMIQVTPTSAERAVIRLDGADYVTIDSFNIITTDVTYGWGIHFTNGANYDSVRACNIDISAVTSTTESNSGGVVMSGSNTSVLTDGNANYNVISNNIIKGSYRGITITGTTNATNATGNKITRNIIQDFYQNGIELADNDSAIVSLNDIHRMNRGAVTTFAGVELNGATKRSVIDGNKIHDTHNTATTQTGAAYGVFSSANDAPAGEENKIINNVIYNFNSGSGVQYGLYNSGSDGVFYYHNTVVLDYGGSSAGVARGFFQTSAASNINFRNNIVYVSRAGTGDKHALYFATAGSDITSNNNVLYVNAGANGGIGSIGTTNYATLTDWQAAVNGTSTYDQQSISVDPMFVSPGNDYTPTEPSVNNMGANVGVELDITRRIRSLATPDPGAYEFSILTAGINMAAEALLTPVASTNNCYSSETVTIRIRNNSVSAIDFSTNPVTVTVNVTGATTQTLTQVLNTGTLASDATMDVVFTTPVNMSAPGTYTFNANTSVTGDVNTANDAIAPVNRTRIAVNAGTVTVTPEEYCASSTINPVLSTSGAAGYSTLQWQQSTTSGTGFTDISGATTATYTVTTPITQTMYYRLIATCGTETNTSVEDTLEFGNPQITGTTPGTRCGPGTVNLSATSNIGTVNWYTSATGGTAVATGNNFTTPIIASNTTYYAAASFGGAPQNVGRPAPASASNLTASPRGLIFNANQPFTLNSVTVYSTAATAGSGTIEVLNSAGTTIAGPMNVSWAGGGTATSPLAFVLPLNFAIPQGTNHRIFMTSLTGGGISYEFSGIDATTFDAYKTAGNEVEILSSITSLTGSPSYTTYYYFYDWVVSTGCESPRTAVTATVTPAPAFSVSQDTTICNNAVQMLQVVSNTADFDSYTWSPQANLYTDAAATIAYTGGNASQVYVKSATAGMYRFYATANNSTTQCGNVDSVDVTIMPVATIISSVSTICNSGSAVLSLDPATGYGTATFQWQQSADGTTYTDISGQTGTSYTTPAITQTTYYRVIVKDGAGNTCNQPTKTIVVNSPSISGTTDAARCGTGSVTLGATSNGGADVKWYADVTGGAVLHTGTSYTTPSLSSTTTYYVAASAGSMTHMVGRQAPASASNLASEPRGLTFNANEPFVLNSVTVYSTNAAAGAGVVELRNSAGTTIAGPINVTWAGGGTAAAPIPYVLPLNIAVPQGTGHKLFMTSVSSGGISYEFSGISSTTFDAYKTPGNEVEILGSVTSYTAAPSYTTYYYFYDWNVTTGCESVRTAVTATINPPNGVAGTSGTSECVTATMNGLTEFNFTDCQPIVKIAQSGASPMSGSVNACVTIDAAVQTSNGLPYVQRHYDITPATNPSTATSTITLYFLQSEFDAHNAANGVFLDLPANSTDATGIANLRITQYNGTGTAPGNYTGSSSLIDPADADIIWNNTESRWEITFSTIGSGGFYVHTGNFILPVTLLNFRGEQSGSINKLLWSTATETNNRGFELEKSADGRNYSSVTFIASKAENGNSTSTLNYSYNDARPIAGSNYYRLKQIDRDGQYSYSNVVLLSRKVSEITLSSVYPNPTERELNLVITSPKSEKVMIIVTDLTGKIIMQRSTQLVTGENQERLNVQQLSAGTYIIKAVCADGCETAVHRFVKQ